MRGKNKEVPAVQGHEGRMVVKTGGGDQAVGRGGPSAAGDVEKFRRPFRDFAGDGCHPVLKDAQGPLMVFLEQWSPCEFVPGHRVGAKGPAFLEVLLDLPKQGMGRVAQRNQGIGVQMEPPRHGVSARRHPSRRLESLSSMIAATASEA